MNLINKKKIEPKKIEKRSYKRHIEIEKECKKTRAKYTKVEVFDSYLELDQFIRTTNFYFIKITQNVFKP